MAATAVLDFWNREILLATRVEMVETHQRAKFRYNRAIGCKDIKIFQFLKMAAVAILDFEICEILLADGVWRALTHNFTKFRQNRSIGCKDIKIFRFFKMAAVRHIRFFWGIYGPPTVSTCGSLSLCKIWLWSMQ